MPGKRGRSRRARGRRSGFKASDSWFSVLSSGQERYLTLKAVEHDVDRPFRPMHITCSVSASGGNSALVQLTVHNVNGDAVASSGPNLVGPNPHTITVSWPRDANVVFKANDGRDTNLVTLTHICVGKYVPFKDTYVLVKGTVHFHSGAELFLSACPAINSKTPLASDLVAGIQCGAYSSIPEGYHTAADLRRSESLVAPGHPLRAANRSTAIRDGVEKPHQSSIDELCRLLQRSAALVDDISSYDRAHSGALPVDSTLVPSSSEDESRPVK